MKETLFFVLIILVINSCDVPDFEELDYGFYDVNIDASAISNEGAYFLFCTEAYTERIEAGQMEQMSYYYFGNTLCQLDLNGKRNCAEILGNNQTIDAEEPFLKDLIRVDYNHQVDSVKLYRYYPIEENYFKVDLPQNDSSFLIPAFLEDDNRIILELNGSILLDTVFYVGDQMLSISI